MPTEPYALTHAAWKIERAQVHLDALKEAVEAFCADSHTITIQDELEGDQVRYRVHVKQPHVYVYLICGDYLQCLRTALDQAVWSLINHATGVDSKSSEFPVFEERLNAKSQESFDKKVKGLSSAAVKYIESIQPYNRPAGFPLSASRLWCLHELNRIDKHRRISVREQVSLAAKELFGLVIPGTDSAEVSEERTNYGFDVVCRGAYKHLKPKISTSVIFGDVEDVERKISMEIDEIGKLYDFVANEVLITLASCAK